MQRRLALLLMTASGFAGLGYQIVWTQQATLWLGHEAASVLAIVTAFFGGLAAGALLLGGRIARSARPVRWYVACELAIAGWSLALAVLMAPVSSWLLATTGAQPGALWQWSMAFGGSFLLLLPATAAMGATLPAMDRVLAQLRTTADTDGASPSIAALYASNTLGAVIGVLATAFWLVPGIGLLRTAAVCAACNLLCAAAAWALARGAAPLAAAVVQAAGGSSDSANNSSSSGSGSGSDSIHTRGRRALWLLAATGLLGIGYEVLVVRVLSQVSEDTVYTFALLLAVYLVGTAAGAAAYQRWHARWQTGLQAGPETTNSDALRDRLLWLLATACTLGTLSLYAAERLRDGTQQLLGGGMAAALAAEATLALAAFCCRRW